jgi:protein-tyrosine kinase
MSDNTSRKVGLASAETAPSGLALHSERLPPALGTAEISWAVMERHRLISALDDQRLIDCYALLRARVLRRLRQQDLNVLGVTSPSGEDGKTLTAVNLALSIAMADSNPVLLVDADLRRPSIARLFGIEPGAGLADYLAGKASIEDVVLRLPIPGMHLLPGSAEAHARPDALSSRLMRTLIQELKEQYADGVVVVDLPPVLVGGDVVSLAPDLDATLLVAADRRTHEDALRRALWLLEEVNVIGTVLNFAEELISSDDYYTKA